MATQTNQEDETVPKMTDKARKIIEDVSANINTSYIVITHHVRHSGVQIKTVRKLKDRNITRALNDSMI